MRFVIRRGLILVLDLVNSTQVTMSLQNGEHSVLRIITDLAHCFWQVGAEVLTFTGDGVLAFLEDRGQRSAAIWAFSDAIRACNSVSALAAHIDPRLRLRGAVDYCDVLQILDPPFEHQHVGRNICRLEEIAESARAQDSIADHMASILATDSADQLIRLPTHRPRMRPSPSSRLLRTTEDFQLLDLPNDPPGGPWFEKRSSGNKRLPLIETSTGLIMFLKWKQRIGLPPFPRDLRTYMGAMEKLVCLMWACRFQALNIVPLGVLGFAACKGNAAQIMQGLFDVLFSEQGRDAVKEVRSIGWPEVTLRVGVVYGPVQRVLSGALESQSLGVHIAYTARFADKVSECFDLGSQTEVPDISLAFPLQRAQKEQEKENPLPWEMENRFWEECHAAFRRRALGVRKLSWKLLERGNLERATKNIDSVYSKAQVWFAIP